MGLHRVIARVDTRNEPSARVARRLGMRQEAHLLRNEWFKGEWSDEFNFAILEDEWRARTATTAVPADSAPHGQRTAAQARRLVVLELVVAEKPK